jgi:hypothetical protein
VIVTTRRPFVARVTELRCHKKGVTGVVCTERRNRMNLTLWIIAGLLSVVYLGAGAGKLVIPKEKLAAFPGGGWVDDFSAGAVKTIGALEVLAAIGLVLPAALDIVPVLVPLAAFGLVLLMAGAAITRIRRHEVKPLVADLVYLALAGFVAWGRFGPESFTG